MPNAFEEEVKGTFRVYEQVGQAHLDWLYPPFRVTGSLGGRPAFSPVGTSPYDVGGYSLKDGTAIRAELKQTSKHAHSLGIVAPDRRGSGLLYHQLEALVKLHEAGGYALLLWNNGGEVGVLDGPGLVLAKIGYDGSLKVRNPAKGARSILWGAFKPVQRGHDGVLLWL